MCSEQRQDVPLEVSRDSNDEKEEWWEGKGYGYGNFRTRAHNHLPPTLWGIVENSDPVDQIFGHVAVRTRSLRAERSRMHFPVDEDETQLLLLFTMLLNQQSVGINCIAGSTFGCEAMLVCGELHIFTNPLVP